MKILHIIPNLNKGGAERLVTDIVRELKKRSGIEVCLVLFRNEIEYEIEDIEDVVKIIPASVQLSLWKKNKLHVEQLQAFIDDFHPDIIHSHLFEAEIVSRSCYYPKAKWFSHAHSNMPALNSFSINTVFNKNKLTNFYERNYLIKQYNKNGGNTYIAISKNTYSYLKSKLPFYNTHELNNAIDYQTFYNKETDFTSEQLKLINVGSVSRNKNQEFLIKVANLLSSKNINFQLVFLGDGKDRAKLESKVANLGLKNSIIFKGSVQKVEQHLDKADIYVHAAFSEAFGLVLLEAMAAGLPVITLDGKGNRDLIEEGKNGYMIYEQDAQKFAEQIIELWNDKATMKEMSTYAQNYAKQFDIAPYIDKLLTIYKSK